MTGILSESRHVTLTKQLPACSRSGVFSKITEGALFLPGVKDERSPLKRGVSLVSATPPPRKQPRAGYLEGMGIGSRSGKVTGRGQRA